MNEKIQATYEELDSVAKLFAQQADAIGKTLQSVQGAMDSLQGGGWIGRGADAFFAEMSDEVLPAVQRLGQALEQGGQTTQQISATVAQAEDEASSRFRLS
ncbi:MAG: WXG100 family type VII secretion target [Chloroflexota bacterium]